MLPLFAIGRIKDDSKTAPILNYLLDNGADIQAKNQWGESLIHSAVSWENLNAVEILVNRGADITAKSETGQPPLFAAVAIPTSDEDMDFLFSDDDETVLNDEDNLENEEAAFMAMGGYFGGGPDDEFRCDHPFLFLIIDDRTGLLLFAGRIVEP